MKILFLLFTCWSLGAQPFDLVITNGKIIDGSGKPAFFADIGIQKGLITFIGRNKSYKAKQIIDAKGLIVAPGFIDVHAHIEGNDLIVPTADNFIRNGVTTVITGNCGSSRTSMKDYFNKLDSIKMSINVASLIGHNSVRSNVMGEQNRDASAAELTQMESLVEEAMKEGAIGISTGLAYVPGMYAKAEEVVQLSKIVSRYNGVYASHIRNEGDKVFESIEEAIDIGRKANVPVQISHLKISSRKLWGRANEVLEKIMQARQGGIDVTMDQYPYVASSTSLDSILPGWALSGGRDSVSQRLNDLPIREKIKKEMLANLAKRNEKDYSFAVVSNHRPDTTLNGKTIPEVNILKRRLPSASEEVETIFDLIAAATRTQMVYFSMSEEDIVTILKDPFNMIASDGGIARFGTGMPHPRSYGTNARILEKYVREEKVISLEEAIRKMTSLPAGKFNFHDRGLIRKGMAADILVFDETTVGEVSTYAKPHAYSHGFKAVVVNGEVVVNNDLHTGIRSGKVLRHTGEVATNK